MYEIWSVGHKPFEGYTNPDVGHTPAHYDSDCKFVSLRNVSMLYFYLYTDCQADR